MSRSTRFVRRDVPSRRHKLASLLLPCIAALCASPAWAQASNQAASTDAARAENAGDKNSKTARDAEVLDAVTVTATRRREPLRDVPLRVEALSVEGLERSGAASLSDYIGNLPGVMFNSDGGPGRGQLNVRGVGVGSLGTTTVGTYIDEVASGSSTSFVGTVGVSALDMSLLDLNHIELLRGPQGTLYGAGAMGGLLKYVTNEPDSYGLSGKVGLGLRGSKNGALGHTEHAVLNVPLSEGAAAMRVALFNDHDGGYITAVGRAAGEHINDGDTRGGRVSLLLEPMSKMKVRLTATQQTIEREGTGLVQYGSTVGDPQYGQPLYGDLTRHLSVAEPYRIKNNIASADLEYDFGWARLNAILSDQRMKSRTVQDASDIIGVPGTNFVELDNMSGLDKRTQELRLTSARGTVEWLLGAYHNKESGSYDQTLWAQMAADGSNLTLVTAGTPSSFEENAVYGDLTYNPSAALSFTVGARVARNKQLFTALTNGVADFTTPAEDDSTTYLATARYSLDKNSSVYFRAASGYRPGGPNPPAIDQNGQLVPGAPTSFGPDTLWSYEAGYKADLLDKRLSLELALFDIHWSDLQLPMVYGATTVRGNAGKAVLKGIELAAHYRLDEHWSLDGQLASNEAKLTEDAPGLGPAGSRIPNVAKFSASLGARYAFALRGKPSYAGLNVTHVGQRNAGYDAAGSSVPNFSMPAYTLVDAQWGLDLGRWQIAAFVRNLGDKRAILSADTALTAFGGPLNATPATPRTIGATVSASF
ncbi:TonB-dependent receptor [Roseateles violae]|uniref:TonB-dependent receptor n=1 Tax=Roseateles violae TaxID=3058042 RepID=A0ABT8DXN8_9BURK|nr:TonB-dependent receptor [Pelomonas sp. PFR6]MDN3922129.1 TonB-dependent receptor [Pelomonas sp. PFR6]